MCAGARRTDSIQEESFMEKLSREAESIMAERFGKELIIYIATSR